MASIPRLYSDYQFPSSEFPDISSAISQEIFGFSTFGNTNFNPNNCAMLSQAQVNFPAFFENNGIESEGYPPENEAFSRVPVNTGCFSDQFGFNYDSAAAVPCSSNSSSYFDNQLDFESNIAGGNNDRNNYTAAAPAATGFQFSDGSSCEYGEEYCGFVPNFKSVCPEIAGDNWGIQCNQMPAIENTNIKVGRYTVEERKDRILRYLKKRNQRNFNKTIKYACRKTLADRRVRVRGRFARNNELCEEESEVKKSDNPHLEKVSYNNDLFEMKNEDDEWLQEAVASLMYLPYVAEPFCGN